MTKTFILAVALAGVSAPAMAQDLSNNSASNSDAAANSGSVSGAESNGNQQGQSQANIGGNNAGIGTSRSNSDSNAVSGSESYSGARSDQAQGQSLDNRSTTSTNTAQTQGQTASNMQGVSTNIQFNSTNRKYSYVGTNTPVPLAASSSFSSDYCGGTVSGGASVAPIGLSIGGAGTKFDDSCRYLRMAEKSGMIGANWYNMQQPEMAYKMESLATWAICMAGPQQDKRKASDRNYAMEACMRLGLLGSDQSPPSTPQAYIAPQQPSDNVTPMETQKPNTTQGESYDSRPKTPRGALDPATTGSPVPSTALAH